MSTKISKAVISKSRSKKKPFKLRIIAENNEIINTGSQTFTTNNNCVKNLLANMQAFNGTHIFVVDVSGKKQIEYTLHKDGFKQNNQASDASEVANS